MGLESHIDHMGGLMWGLYRLWILPTLELAFGMGSFKVLYQISPATRNSSMYSE